MSDESCFPSPRGVTRRVYKEIAWLAAELEKQAKAPLPAALPEEGAQYTEFQTFLTAIARDDTLKTLPTVHKFFFDVNEPAAPGLLPETFSCDLDDQDRESLASMPLYYLRAIASATGTSTRGCVTAFEFSDRILAKHAGLDEEEAVPLAAEEAQEAGEGFKGVHQVEEDLFDSLASNRAQQTPADRAGSRASHSPTRQTNHSTAEGEKVALSPSSSSTAAATAEPSDGKKQPSKKTTGKKQQKGKDKGKGKGKGTSKSKSKKGKGKTGKQSKPESNEGAKATAAPAAAAGDGKAVPSKTSEGKARQVK